MLLCSECTQLYGYSFILQVIDSAYMISDFLNTQDRKKGCTGTPKLTKCEKRQKWGFFRTLGGSGGQTVPLRSLSVKDVLLTFTLSNRILSFKLLWPIDLATRGGNVPQKADFSLKGALMGEGIKFLNFTFYQIKVQ